MCDYRVMYICFKDLYEKERGVLMFSGFLFLGVFRVTCFLGVFMVYGLRA